MIKLYSPRNEVELALLRSVLEGEGIPFFIHNDNFGTLKAGPRIESFTAKTIMVPEEQAARAMELIDDYRRKVEPDSNGDDPGYTVLDKLRMFFEVLFAGWIMPGKRRRTKDS